MSPAHFSLKKNSLGYEVKEVFLSKASTSN